MKGLLLNSALQHKTFYIITLCTSAVLIILTAILFGACSDNPEVMSVAILVPYLSLLIIPVVLFEGVGRKTERMLKCGFLKYTLTSGVSKIKYAAAETLLNLIYTAISAILLIILFLVAAASAPEYVPPAADFIRIILVFSLFIGALTSIINTLVLFTKNEEIASLIIGCILGFFVGVFMLIQNIRGEHLEIKVDNTLAIIVALVCLAIYALSTVVMTLRLQRYSG